MSDRSGDFLVGGDAAHGDLDTKKQGSLRCAHCDIGLVRALAEDRLHQTVTDLLLRDHPERAALLRLAGVEERFVTGDGSDYEKFRFFCTVMGDNAESLVCEQMQAELAILLGCPLLPCAENCDAIWQRAGEVLSRERFTARTLLRRCGIDTLLVTLPPEGDLSLLKRTAQETGITILPVLCADSLLDVRGDLAASLRQLGALTGIGIDSPSTLGEAVDVLLDRFAAAGCTAAVHTVWPRQFLRPDPYHAGLALQKVLEGSALSDEAYALLGVQLWRILGIAYKRRNMRLELPSGGVAPMREAQRPEGRGAMLPYGIAAQLLDYLNGCAGLPRVRLYAAEPGEVPDALALAAQYPNPPGLDGALFSFGIVPGTQSRMQRCVDAFREAYMPSTPLEGYPDFRLSTSLSDRVRLDRLLGARAERTAEI